MATAGGTYRTVSVNSRLQKFQDVAAKNPKQFSYYTERGQKTDTDALD